MLFRVRRHLPYGASVHLTGSTKALGEWCAGTAPVCRWTPEDMWTIDVNPLDEAVTPPTRLEFKFFERHPDGRVVWEDTPDNHAVVLVAGAAAQSETGEGNGFVAPVMVTVQWGISNVEDVVGIPVKGVGRDGGRGGGSGGGRTVGTEGRGVDVVRKGRKEGAHGLLQTVMESAQAMVRGSPPPTPTAPVGDADGGDGVGVTGTGRHDVMTGKSDNRGGNTGRVGGDTNNALPIAAARAAAAVANGDAAGRSSGRGVQNSEAADGEGNYRVKFRMRKGLASGERMYIVGSSPMLGRWNKMHSPRLELVSGTTDIYEVSMYAERQTQNAQRFEYKYFTRRADGARTWENGDNRVGDFRQFDSAVPASGDDEGMLVLDDRWERIRLEFSIFMPGTKGRRERMHITGDLEEIGGWFKPGPVAMTLGPMQMLETEVKGRKWVLKRWVKAGVCEFQYRYISIDVESELEIWEREPNRRGVVEAAGREKGGEEGEDGSDVVEKGVGKGKGKGENDIVIGRRILNGVRVFKDLNFVTHMKVDDVPPSFVIGPYPQSVGDVDVLAECGVRSVLNVQTDEDFEHRGIKWGMLMGRYKDVGIEVVRYPIRDFDRDSLRGRLKGATKVLERLVGKGGKVYVHCTAGMGRAPACVVAYLCWVKGMELDEAVAHVKKYRTVAVPNVPVLREALNEPY